MSNIDIQTIIQGGAVGICVLLVFLIGFIINRVLKLVGNHINSNTAILTKLAEKIDQDISAQKETAETLRDLQVLIKK